MEKSVPWTPTIVVMAVVLVALYTLAPSLTQPGHALYGGHAHADRLPAVASR